MASTSVPRMIAAYGSSSRLRLGRPRRPHVHERLSPIVGYGAREPGAHRRDRRRDAEWAVQDQERRLAADHGDDRAGAVSADLPDQPGARVLSPANLSALAATSGMAEILRWCTLGRPPTPPRWCRVAGREDEHGAS